MLGNGFWFFNRYLNNYFHFCNTMCYDKSYLTKRLEKYAKRYGRGEEEITFVREQIRKLNLAPAYHASGFDHPLVPVMIDTTRQIHLFSWGLIPNWIKSAAKAVAISNSTINARVETMFEKPAFREAARTRRCLVMADGFFEHHHKNKKAFPYHIRLKDDEPMALAGLWDEWIDEQSGVRRRTYTILTTRANAVMTRIHNNAKLEEGPRMPLIIPKQFDDDWLKPVNNYSDKELIAEITRPFPDSELESFTVRRLRGKEAVGNKPEALHPFRYPELEETQGSLF
jgi:putative SOS response-associated peptidase YedK